MEVAAADQKGGEEGDEEDEDYEIGGGAEGGDV